MRYWYRLFGVFSFTLFIFVLFGSFSVREVEAAQLNSVKDTITTSRPSAASPLTSTAASGVSQFSIADNGSRFLASDSAQVVRGTGVFSMTGLNVASQSADRLTVYLGQTTSQVGGSGSDTLIVPVTAKHTISFQTATQVPSNGKITITFPGSSPTNAASPSASTFAFNGFTGASNITAVFAPTGPTCSGFTVSGQTITCQVATAIIPVNTTVTITIGSTTPVLINPTKTNQTAGQADTWKVAMATTDNSGNGIDAGTTKIATVESVQVQATVEPTLTFTISGVNNNVNINTISSSCGSITTNTGLNTDATSVNLGVLSNGYVSAAAQQLQVSTNAAGGYVITATSSGQLKNPATGAIIIDANGGTGLTANDTPVPTTIVAGTAEFGIHPCGIRSSVNTDQWVNAGTISTAKFSNPWNTGTNAFYNTLASYSGGPVSLENTAVLYGATISGTTPAGTYLTTLTYVATATF